MEEESQKRIDDRRERDLNERLEEAKQKYIENEKSFVVNRFKKINILEELVDIYDSLKIEVFDYDEEDFKNKLQELEELKRETTKENNNEIKEEENINKEKEER